MNWVVILEIIYGILTIVGGTIGYLKSKSKISLISGLISGFLLFTAAFLEIKGYGIGRQLAQVVTVVLIIVFGLRLRKTRKFMPAGLMLIAGVFSLIILLNA